MEDFVGGEFVDPKIFFRGGILRDDRAEDRGHSQNDQQGDGEAEGRKDFPERKEKVFSRSV
jgi:hypothetical protein